MKSKVMLKEIPEKFREIEKNEYALDQKCGSVIAAPAGNMGKELKDIVVKLKSLCGACFGAHLAEMAGTMTERKFVSYLVGNYTRNPNAKKLALKLTSKDKGRTLRVHDFLDGKHRLADLLFKGKDFKDWLRKNYHHNNDVRSLNSLGRIMVDDYLNDLCGAPRECFSSGKWPKSIRPSMVMDKVLERNPELAEETI